MFSKRFVSPRQAGVGLIDVLMAILVIGFGVVGLARLQGVAFSGSGTSKTRTLALDLARGKQDDLRSFTQLASGGNGTFGYDEIDSNVGGTENTDGTLRLPSGNVTVGNVTYTRNWTVTKYYFCTYNAPAVTANCSGSAAKTRPDYYAVRVAIGWTDPKDGALTTTLDDTIDAMDPLSAALSLMAGGSSEAPIVRYVPGLAPQVIAIDIGGNQNKETTNPTPTLNKKGQAVINVIAKYETIRYSSADNTITREEYQTLNCSCKEDGTGSALNLRGQTVTKRVGVPSDRDQAFECTVCCRDHHDDATCDPTTSGGKNNCYDPYRPSSGINNDYNSTTHDHNHYNANGQLANNTGDVYREACRLKRVNGFLQVAQDWHMAQLNVIPQSYFVSSGGTVNATHVADYANYVKDYIKYLIAGGTAPTKGWSSSESVSKNTTDQLLARGIYMDYLDDAVKSAYASKLNSGDATVYQQIPFYDVNMTKLAQWATGSSAIATVTNDQVVTEAPGQNLYSRGLVKGVGAGVTPATASTFASNTGVINEFITTDPDDGSVVLSDRVDITVPGATITVSGTISPAIAGVSIVGNGSGSNSNFTCTYTASSGAYSCTVPSGWSGDIVPSATGYSFTPGSSTLSGVTSNQTINFTDTTTAATSFTISGTVSTGISGLSLAASGTPSGGTCTVAATGGSFTCTVPSGWSGSIIPSASSYTFSPGSYSASNVSSNLTGVTFTASTVTSSTYTISGTINAAPTASTVTVAATGSSAGTCTFTSSSSSYSCTVPSAWTGTVTPSSATGVTFSPTLRSYSAGVSADLTNQNFSTSYRISGSVSPNTGTAVVTGVLFAATGSGSSANGTCAYDSTTTPATYSCTVSGLWNGSITPSKSNASFSPAARTYANVTSVYSTENYTATDTTPVYYTISGSVTALNSGTASVSGSAGATCTLGTLSGNGSNKTLPYSCSVLSGSTVVITPSVTFTGNKSVTLTPSSKTFSNVTANSTSGNNFACSGNGC